MPSEFGTVPTPMKPMAYHAAGTEPLPPDVDALHEAVAAAADTSSTAAAESYSLRRLLGESSAPEPLHLRYLPKLSWDDRLMGFAGCFVIGLTISLTSMFSFTQLLLGDPAPFAWKLSIGNLLAIASSSFLAGPKSQCEKMTSPVRLGATAVYLGSIVFTLVAALGLHRWYVTLLSIVAQFAALAWYCASYIPFGRALIKRVVGKTCCPVGS